MCATCALLIHELAIHRPVTELVLFIFVSRQVGKIRIICFHCLLFRFLGKERPHVMIRYSNFGAFPFPRLSVAEFYTKCIHQWVSPLTMIIGFTPSLIRMCSMHTIHLGICQWLNASVILDLCDLCFFKGGTLAQKLVSLTHAFNKWCRVNGIE